MEFIGILLILILIALWRIGSVIADKGTTSIDLTEIEERLNEISRALGGKEKVKESIQKERAELKKRVAKLLSQKEADRLFEEAENEEKFNEFSYKFRGIEDWVKREEKERYLRGKYERLLEKARDFIKDKTELKRYRNGLQEALETDYEGAQWLIKQLVEEKKLEEVKKWNKELESSEVVSWKIVNPN